MRERNDALFELKHLGKLLRGPTIDITADFMNLSTSATAKAWHERVLCLKVMTHVKSYINFLYHSCTQCQSMHMYNLSIHQFAQYIY